MKFHGILTAFVVLVTSASLTFAGPGQGQKNGKGGPGGKGKPSAESVLKQLDKDGNGSISKAEAPERMSAHFDRIDVDGDGAITLEEIKAAFKKRAERGAGKGQGGKRPEGKGPGGKGQGGKRKPTPADFLKKFDKNADGSLSKDELPEKMQDKFDRVDQNSDGSIDANELKAMFAKRAERGGKGAGGNKPGGKKPESKPPVN